jgi:site-specific DNA-methyltransferase (cytosine-N4-specific)
VNKVFFGDCQESMRQMIADGVKVQMAVTSPPYFGLRDYGHPGQLGLEATPQEYVSNLVEVFRLVRELLNKDGTLWLNLGDSYAANRGYQVASTLINGQATNEAQAAGGKGSKVPDGLKPKDLIGIPWHVAFALQADGWFLRQDIIWAKPNPMPESVTDRCTKSHEYMFLLSKSERYYFDHEAIKEPAVIGNKPRNFGPQDKDGGRDDGNKRDNYICDGTRNRRSVWEVATQPYSGAHFATFPPALIEPCIAAGSRPGDVVLDPFFGSGTTGQVCESLGRKWIGCEVNDAYLPLQKKRTAQMGIAFA